MKKGFTLIELLAVIVILAIIALIATPLIMNIINEAQIGAFEDSSYAIINAAEQGYAASLISNTTSELTEYSYADGERTLVSGNVEVNYKRSNPSSGRMLINEDGNVAIAFYSKGYCTTKSYAASKVTTIKMNEEDCIMPDYDETVLNGANPELSEGMIAVVIESDGTVKKADIENKWYDYEDKEWANAILVNETSRSTYESAEAGTIIAANDILSYYVWIPRYKYKIWNDGNEYTVNTTSEPESSEQTIEIVFESNTTTKSQGDSTGEWLTHPAFTFGTEDLNGIWVGKFETTGTTDKVTILPNTTSLRRLNINTMFTLSRSIEDSGNIYGLAASKVDTHMMKNMEWGAVAYLSHSKYGIDDEIRYNNSTTYITGCAASNEPTTGYSTPGYSGCENAYNTETGYLASTTGNITGIYDMAGGSYEYVMAVMEDSTATNTPLSGRNSLYNSGFNGLLGCPTCDSQDGSITEITDGINFPDSKYYDLYEYGTSSIDYSRGKLGDATIELGNFGKSTIETNGSTRYISSWYHDNMSIVTFSSPWFFRGGSVMYGKGNGIFTSGSGDGRKEYGDVSFRQVLTIE
ncbi:MAG: prepilin-type N-terminal cleavage/methylation domain-containing protein [Bacilli bacterium]|nr:prepilin-type N-terminal cleavage/methylation domain-containing protein [Bacilli bacterium]